jgi:hypothetical protein
MATTYFVRPNVLINGFIANSDILVFTKPSQIFALNSISQQFLIQLR